MVSNALITISVAPKIAGKIFAQADQIATQTVLPNSGARDFHAHKTKTALLSIAWVVVAVLK